MLLPALAVLFSGYLAVVFLAVVFPVSPEAVLVPPHIVVRQVWDATDQLFTHSPVYAGLVYFLLVTACVWWYARPRVLSCLTLLMVAALTGPSAFCLSWIVFGIAIGHS